MASEVLAGVVMLGRQALRPDPKSEPPRKCAYNQLDFIASRRNLGWCDRKCHGWAVRRWTLSGLGGEKSEKDATTA